MWTKKIREQPEELPDATNNLFGRTACTFRLWLKRSRRVLVPLPINVFQCRREIGRSQLTNDR